MAVGKAEQGITKKSLSLKVSKPHRWDLETPYLYTLKTELETEQNKTLAEYEYQLDQKYGTTKRTINRATLSIRNYFHDVLHLAV